MTGNLWFNGETIKCNPRTGHTEAVILGSPRCQAAALFILPLNVAFVIASPESIPELLVFMALGLFCGVVAAASVLTYQVGADKEEIYCKSLFTGRKSIRTDQIKAIYVEHYEKHFLGSGRHLYTNIMVLKIDASLAFSIDNREKFLRPLVTFLKNEFPDQVEEGDDPSQYDSSQFVRLLAGNNNDLNENVDRSLLTTSYVVGVACQLPAVVMLAIIARALLKYANIHSWRIITLFFLVVLAALSSLYLIICNLPHRPSRIQAPRVVRVPMLAATLNLIGCVLLWLFLLCTWSWWAPNWLWPFVVAVVFDATVYVLVAVKNVAVVRQLRDQVQASRSGYSEVGQLV